MTSDDEDLHDTVAFGSSHGQAMSMLPVALIMTLFGVAVMVVAADSVLLGGAIAGLGGALLAVIAVRVAQQPKAAIVVSRDGLLFTDVSQQIIPWREIVAVEFNRVREISAPTKRRVVSIAVSRGFFATLSPKVAWPDEVVWIGEPTWIHLAYYRPDVPVDELAALIRARRRA